MHQRPFSALSVEEKIIKSQYLRRGVRIDVYMPVDFSNPNLSLLLINDGQDLPKMNFANLLDQLITTGNIRPVLCVGIYAGDRMMEYGTNGTNDFAGRGARSGLYQLFLIEELIPLVHRMYGIEKFSAKAIAGFSLGGLSAIDTLWSYRNIFSVVGVFSGSLWWRSKDLNEGYNEEKDRIMHSKIGNGIYHPGLKFYLTTGSLDETADRNNNGVIDSIDDTIALIEELRKLGYTDKEIRYINYEEGRHDIESWGRAMLQFLLWAWGK